MKKIIVVMMLLLALTGTGYGAEVYVRKDIFDAKFDMVMEELKAQRRTITELSDRVANLSGRVEALSVGVDGVDKRIDDLRKDLFYGLVIFGIFMFGAKLMATAQQQEQSASSITLEDVKQLIDQRLIEENNARMSGKVQA